MTATTPQATGLRDCRLYRFWVEHPVTGEEVLGYIGETVRQPFDRLMEHVGDKPWIDTVTRWERDPQVFAGKRAVLDAEAAAIREERPLYNVRQNEDNHERIIPPLAIRQRRARDLERDKPRWVHPDDREAVRSVPPMTVRRVSPTRSWPAGMRTICIWCGAWLLLAIATLGAFSRYGLTATWKVKLLTVCLAPTLLLLWGRLRRPDTCKLWRRRLRSLRKALR